MITPDSNLSHFSFWIYRMAEASSTVSFGMHSASAEPSCKLYVNAHAVQFDVEDILKKMKKNSTANTDVIC